MESISHPFLRLWKSVQAAATAALAGSSSSSSFSSTELEKEIVGTLEDLESIKQMSAWIKAVLVDAEEKAVRGEQVVRQWLTELQQLAYRASDLLGLYEYEVVAQQIRDQEERKDLTPKTAGKRKFGELSQVRDSSPFIDTSFRQDFACRIRKFRKDFDDVNHQMEALNLQNDDEERIRRSQADIIKPRHTGSEPVDDVFLGRENDMEELIRLLISDNIVKHDPGGSSTCVPVIALVGMGGVGKTTLVQRAFNDPEVCKHFSERGWVCVSDDFHVQRLTGMSIAALTGGPQGFSFEELGILQHRLKNIVQQNTFLLVLDDVWNENVELWDSFYTSLKHGAKGSKIIITTRSEIVADKAQAVEIVDVGCLSEEDAWSLFRLHTFGNDVHFEAKHPGLVDLGKQITEKCKGLPLALKVLGRFLRDEEKDEEIWNDVMMSDLWEPQMWEEGKQVLGPLALSYLHLPAYLKPCFLITSVFPKDTEIVKQKLAGFWMAHELVEDYNEETAMVYINNLISRSFFQEHVSGFLSMHDFIHDLAQHLSRDKMLPTINVLFNNDAKREVVISHEVQHAYIQPLICKSVQLCHDHNYSSCLRTVIRGHITWPPYELNVQSPGLVDLGGLRTLDVDESQHVRKDGFLQSCLKTLKNLHHLEIHGVLAQETVNSVCQLYNLRSLYLSSYKARHMLLPDAIGNLRHLTSLTVDGVSEVPKSIGYLTKLRKLDLQTANFHCLPDSVSKLVSLRILVLSLAPLFGGPENIVPISSYQKSDLAAHYPMFPRLDAHEEPLGLYFPAGFGSLTKLQELPLFKVPPRGSATELGGIEELKGLVGIRFLSIGGLSNVVRQEDAMRAELMNKTSIRKLELDWGEQTSGFDLIRRRCEEADGEETLPMAVEHEHVLEILRPHTSLQLLWVSRCRARRLASWLGDVSFVNLDDVYLRLLPNCTSLYPLHQLPSLKNLAMRSMPSLVHLVPPSLLHSGSNTRSTCFPCLQQLRASYCQSLTLVPLDMLTVLEKIHFIHCPILRFSESANVPTGLKVLDIWSCPLLKDWCCTHRSSKLAHLPNVQEQDDDIEFSR